MLPKQLSKPKAAGSQGGLGWCFCDTKAAALEAAAQVASAAVAAAAATTWVDDMQPAASQEGCGCSSVGLQFNGLMKLRSHGIV